MAIVTGAASGIGKSIACKLGEYGAAVVVADRDEPRGAAVAAQISSGSRSFFVQMDLGNFHDIDRVVEFAAQQFGSLDILVNCAAVVGAHKPLTMLTLEDWQQDLSVNLTGPFLLTQAAVRQMLLQPNKGAIVNILALQADVPLPNRSAYAASKAAMGSLTRSLAVEFADQGIRANDIAVASVYTDSVRDTLNAPPGNSDRDFLSPPEYLDNSSATLIGRMGRPHEIANLAIFLASDEASYLVGATIPADGGRSLSRKPDPFLSE